MSLALIALLPQLLAAGVSTATQIRSLIASFHPGMTDAELDAVLATIQTAAQVHLAQAKADQQPNVAAA